ncbi:MAG: Gene 25-like lysozyme [bacterium ADurb.Bin429]|nr:MAG: Gene 25-like lysozyme [bacterium ADurb.Bin429]
MNDILGIGLKYPFQFHKQYGGAAISTATSQEQEHIHESIRQILGTRRGERFLRPEFGCRLHELLFEGNIGHVMRTCRQASARTISIG